MNNPARSNVTFFLTPENTCSYLSGKLVTTIVADPAISLNTDSYNKLVAQGFRRSGKFTYRPCCRSCNACVPVRIPVTDFRYTRRFKRITRINQDLVVNIVPAGYTDEYFDLYRRYLSAQHPGGGMDNPDPDDFTGFLCSTSMETVFFEFRKDSRLIAVAVADLLLDAISAVYTFYDPAEKRRSPGNLAIIHEIEHARLSGMKWLYLGYWIAGSRKMNYKNQFQPIQYLYNGKWQETCPFPVINS